jgi:hypothetical protein
VRSKNLSYFNVYFQYFSELIEEDDVVQRLQAELSDIELD